MLHRFQQSQNPSKCCLISFKTLDCTVWMIMKLIFVSSTSVTRFHSTPTFAWLEWASTHQCTIQKIHFWDFMDGMKLSPRSQYFFFLLVLFSPGTYFSLAQFLFSGDSFFITFFFGPPVTPSFFWEAPTYPQPTYQPTYHPHLADPSPPTSFCAHLHHQSSEELE